MRTLIGLRGQSNSDRTSTIRIVYEDLAQRDGGCLEFRNERKERWAIFKIAGVKIGITTGSDKPGLLLPSLQPLLAHCDVVVCTVNEDKTGRLVKRMEDLAAECSPPFRVVWLPAPEGDNPEGRYTAGSCPACGYSEDYAAQSKGLRVDRIVSEIDAALRYAAAPDAMLGIAFRAMARSFQTMAQSLA